MIWSVTRLRLHWLAVLLPLACTAADGVPMVGKADCRFEVPGGWPGADVRWTGSCKAGRAEGLGVLRQFSAGRVQRLYFGRLVAGRLNLGVIEQDDGYVAGQFAAAKVVAGADRNTLIKAFDEASAAATAVAENYLREGNAASAKYYQERAKQLAEQLD